MEATVKKTEMNTEYEIKKIWGLFSNQIPCEMKTLDTRDYPDDFREAISITLEKDERYVLKLAANEFTFPERIAMWERTAKEYRRLGFYAPKILTDLQGGFPRVEYKGHDCVAYVEEFAPYKTAGEPKKDDKVDLISQKLYIHEVWRMTAKVAQKHFDFTEYLSAWCLFDLFDSTYEEDEVMENAHAWKEYADSLPEKFKEQVERIWNLWIENKNQLEPVYRKLPKSVFQADINSSNILLDDNNRFIGIFDFNLAGKEVVLNYLFRETLGNDFEDELDKLFEMLQVVGEYYEYSELEKEWVLKLYRYLKPMWYIKVENLKNKKDDWKAVRDYLDKTEEYLTKDIDFMPYMSNEKLCDKKSMD